MKNILLIIGFMITSIAHGQEVFGTNGGLSSASNHTLTYTLGQPFIQSVTVEDGYYSEGFQQSVLLQENIPEEDLTLHVYPNPALHSITINASNTSNIYELYDIKGAKVLRYISHNLVDQILVDHLARGIYIMKTTTPTGQYQFTKLILQ